MNAGSHHNPRVGGSSPSSAIQVDREFSGGSRSVYAVMSDELCPAIAGLARSRLVSARVESLLRYSQHLTACRTTSCGMPFVVEWTGK